MELRSRSATVTFVLTDIVGSTQLWEREPAAMGAAMSVHDAIFDASVSDHAGNVVRPRGEGDSRFAVFDRATDAALAAASIVASLQRVEWETSEAIQVRVGVHTGEVEERDGDFYGTAVNLCARLRGLGHPGQVLLSETSARLVVALPPHCVSIRDVGVHRLKGLRNSERVFQLCHPDLSDSFPPLAGEAEIWSKEYQDRPAVPSIASGQILQIALGERDASNASRATWASKPTPESASEHRGIEQPGEEPIVVVGAGTAAGRFHRRVTSESGKRRSVLFSVCTGAALLVAGTLIATTRSDGTTTTESSVLRPDRLKPLPVGQRRRPILNRLEAGSGCRRFS